MIIAGISIESKSLRLAIIDSSTMELIKSTPKIELENDDNQESVKAFNQTFCAITRDYNIDRIYIKKRAQKGDHASGPISFKIEGIIQLVDIPVQLISANTIAAFIKRNEVEIPSTLYKYQHDAYKVAHVSIEKYINV